MKTLKLLLGASSVIAPIALTLSCSAQVQTVTLRPITDDVVKTFIEKQWPNWWKTSYRLTVTWKDFYEDKKDFNIEGIQKILIEDWAYPDDEQNQRKIIELTLLSPEVDVFKEWYWDASYGFKSPWTTMMTYELNNYHGKGKPIMWVQSKVV